VRMTMAATSTTVSERVGRQLVGIACRAPSVDNTQPWAWRLRPDGMDLYADHQRRQPGADPTGRELVISCGAALHHTVVAAEAIGAHVEVTTLPEGPGSDLMARFTLTPSHPTDDALTRASLLGKRHTDRRRFTEWPVPAENLEHLAEAGEKWGATVLPIIDRGLRVEVERLLEEARRRQQGDPRIAEETESWIDHGATDGIPTATLPLFRGARGERPTRFGSGLIPDGAESVLHGTDGLLVVSTPDDTPRSWLRAGASLSALWLQATTNGLSVVPLSQLAEVPPTRAALRERLSPLSPVPQVLARVGWQEIGRAELPRPPRRPLDDVLRGLSRPA
jgi:hypothetical protein